MDAHGHRSSLTVDRPLPAEVGGALDAAIGAAYSAVDARLLDLCRARVRQLLGAPSLLSAERDAQLADWTRSADIEPRERVCLAFTDQFVTDVGSMTSDLTGAVLEELGGAGLYAFAFALYAVEQVERLGLVLDALDPGVAS
jgi:hypothetical protein